MSHCPLTGTPTSEEILAEVRWLAPKYIELIKQLNPNWYIEQGASPSYIHQLILRAQLANIDPRHFESVQPAYPLDAEASFGALPSALRLRARPRYTGKGVTIAIIDAGFYPHPDLISPQNRIKAWVDASNDKLHTEKFKPSDTPSWLISSGRPAHQWQGMLNASVTAGNGHLSHGLYRGLAHESDVVLINVFDNTHGISKKSILRAFDWLKINAKQFNVRVVGLSALANSADYIELKALDEHVDALTQKGITVVMPASHNNIRRSRLSSNAITVGSIDDPNITEPKPDDDCADDDCKPTVVIPSMQVITPILPGSDAEKVAKDLFEKRGGKRAEAKIDTLKLLSPHYQHVDGTPFATAIITSIIATMLEGNPRLTPSDVKNILSESAMMVPDVSNVRQGAGVIDAGITVANAVSKHRIGKTIASPVVQQDRIALFFYDPHAHHIEVFGSWNNWQHSLDVQQIEAGLWRATTHNLNVGQYTYKFVVDGHWIHDPANPHKIHDDYTGFNSVVTIK